MKKFVGKISKSAPYSNVSGGYVSIRLEEENSGIHFLEIEMNFEDFGKMMAGQTFVDCTFKVRDVEYIGKERISAIVDGYSNELRTFPQEEIDRITEDGWIIIDSHLKNSNNFYPNPTDNGFMYKVKVYVVRFEDEENVN